MGRPAVVRRRRVCCRPPLTLFCVALLCTAPPPAARALETDQFTVPAGGPLPDIGPEVDAKVLAAVLAVADEASGKARRHTAEAEKTRWTFWKRHHRGRAAEYLSEEHLARRVYHALAGAKVPECKIERWVRQHEFACGSGAGGPVLFYTRCRESVFGDSPRSKPLLLSELSPTVNVYGVHTGLDKLGHVFQQGYQYYKEYRREERRGGDVARATARAVRLGVSQERGFYGEALVGVYSNADLAANYAGLKFYLNLTRPVEIDGRTLPPLLRRGPAGWALNAEAASAGRSATVGALRPFVSEHFSEALNSSRYSRQMRNTIRANLRRRAGQIVAFYQTTPPQERTRAARLATWHGEDYGHGGPDHLITIADHCFPAGPKPTAAAEWPVAASSAASSSAAVAPGTTALENLDSLRPPRPEPQPAPVSRPVTSWCPPE